MRLRRYLLYMNFIWMFSIMRCQLINQAPKIDLRQDALLVYPVFSEAPDWRKLVRVEDREDGNIDVKRVEVISQVDMNQIGEYAVQFLVSDSKGKKAKKTIFVKVVDQEAPTISLLGDENLILLMGYPYQEPGFTVWDNYDQDLHQFVTIKGEVNPNKVGVYELLYTVSDFSGNQAESVKRTITVVDDLSLLISPIVELAIREQLNLPEGKITKQYCEMVNTLNLENTNISSIHGLEYLSKLVKLNLANNQVQDLTPLSKLKNLTDLDLSNNQITDLKPLTPLINLETLLLARNQISDLAALRSLENLKTLDLSYNQIGDLSPISNLNQLEMLNLRHNSITNIKPLKELVYNARIWDKTGWINIMENPLDIEAVQDNYQTMMYYLDHGLNLIHYYFLNPKYYVETHHDAFRLSIGEVMEGYLGFSSDVDWFMLILDGDHQVEIIHSLNPYLKVELYRLENDLELIKLNFESSLYEMKATLPLSRGIYYLKVSTYSHLIPGLYSLCVHIKS